MKSRALEAFLYPLPCSPISIHPSTCPDVRPRDFKESSFPGNPAVIWGGEDGGGEAKRWRHNDVKEGRRVRSRVSSQAQTGCYGNCRVILMPAGFKKIRLGQEGNCPQDGRILNLLYYNHKSTVK